VFDGFKVLEEMSVFFYWQDSALGGVSLLALCQVIFFTS
jgi:hypothetical protein